MIGDLKHRVTIQYPAKVPDSYSGFTVTWTDHATVHAAIWPVSASEQVQAQAPAMIISHRIRIRYRNVMKPSWRISWAGRYFNIVSIIDPNMDHKWLDLTVKEAAA
jgi:SPP1 family predicted phage head-tail adaptor